MLCSIWEPSLTLGERGVSACEPDRVSGAVSTKGKGGQGRREGEQWRWMVGITWACSEAG